MTMLTVNNGQAQVTGNSLNQMVASGQAVQLTGSNPVQLQWVSVLGPDSFDQWCSQRDQKYQNAQARQYVSPRSSRLLRSGWLRQLGDGSRNTARSGIRRALPWDGCLIALAVGFGLSRGAGRGLTTRLGDLLPSTMAAGYKLGRAGAGCQDQSGSHRFTVLPSWPLSADGGFSVGVGVGGVAAWFPLGPGEPFYPWYHYSPVYLRQINVTNVRNINVANITNVTNINNIHYRYQTVATTAVSQNAFRNGEPVARNLVNVSPEQLAHAQVIPHPEVNPTPRAIAAGNATHPPVPAQRPAIVQHPPVSAAAAAAPRSVEPAHPTEAPRPDQPARPSETPHENAPVANNRPSPSAPPAARPPLVSRTAPPQEKLPYQQKAPAMAQHPGRPLEPQQRANIYAGKPAGPMRDQEFPPHASAPASHGSSGAHGGGSKH